MFSKLIVKSTIPLIILNIGVPLKIQAEHKNSLINKFCIATLKAKLNIKNKKSLDQISHYTCECFSKKFKAGSSIKNSRIYCRDKAAEKFNL